MKAVNYLQAGLYTPQEAARLIGVSPTRIRGWVQGYPNVDADPVIKNEIPRADHHIVLSFINLIEALFIAQFSRHGIHVRSIRAMAAEAKTLFRNPHPFASAHIFKTDGRRIFAEVIERVGDKKLSRLYDLQAHNYALPEILENEFKEHVVYGPEGYAHLWYPRKKDFPNVLINPNVAFGQPVMKDSGIPTTALYGAYQAENKNAALVAKWFKTKPASVREAIRFEDALAGTA